MAMTTRERAALAVTTFLLQNTDELAEIITDHILDNFDSTSPVECARSLFVCALDNDAARLFEEWQSDPPAHVAYHYLPRMLRAFGVESDSSSITAAISAATANCGQPLNIDVED